MIFMTTLLYLVLAWEVVLVLALSILIAVRVFMPKAPRRHTWGFLLGQLVLRSLLAAAIYEVILMAGRYAQ